MRSSIRRDRIGGTARAVIAAVLVGALLWIAPVHAATIAVTTTADEVSGNGQCSLREAIRAANLDIRVDACAPGSGADTISLPAGTYLLTRAGTREDEALTGDLDISGDLTLVGAGAGTTIIDGNSLDVVIAIVSPFAIVNLSQLTVRGAGGDPGGGIGNSGTLTLSNVVVRDNRSNVETGAGINNEGILIVTTSTIMNNVGADFGGGVWNGGSAVIQSSTISGNRTAEYGAGIFNEEGGRLRVHNSTISGNIGPSGSGAGIENRGLAIVKSSTIANNQGAPIGGIDNDSGTVYLSNTILANNVNIDIGGVPSDCRGTLTSEGYNLIGTMTDCTIEGTPTGNLVNVDPKLGPLQSNGGTTATHALLSGSPALDAADPAIPRGLGSTCPTVDQRGQKRPRDGTGDGAARCDIGAFERQPTDGTGTGLTGRYYDNRDFTALKATRTDPTVDFAWGGAAPIAGMGVDTFAVRWTGQVQPRFSETYTFSTQNDDGARLWVNGQLIIDDWTDHAVRERSGTIALSAGQRVTIRLDYYDNTGGATIRLLWASPGQPKQIIPADRLYPAN